MPLTKDLICISGTSKAAASSVNFNAIKGGLSTLHKGSILGVGEVRVNSDESDEMNGVDLEFSDFEKTIA